MHKVYYILLILLRIVVLVSLKVSNLIVNLLFEIEIRYKDLIQSVQ